MARDSIYNWTATKLRSELKKIINKEKSLKQEFKELKQKITKISISYKNEKLPYKIGSRLTRIILEYNSLKFKRYMVESQLKKRLKK